MEKTKEWHYLENENRWLLLFCPYYNEEIVAQLHKDECGDWLLDSIVLRLKDEYIDNFNDHECLEVIQSKVEEKIHEHYLEEAKYYKELADKFMEEN